MPRPVLAALFVVSLLGVGLGIFIGGDYYCYGPTDGDAGCGMAVASIACLAGVPITIVFALIAIAADRMSRIDDPYAASLRGHELRIIIAGALGALVGFFAWPVSDWLINQDAVTALFEAQPAKEARAEAPLNDPSPPIGTLDLANCEQLAGWAWDPKTPSQPIDVQIYDHFEDGTEELVVRIAANLSRPDVVRVTGDNGMHGFAISTPAALRDGLSHTIRAYAVNSDARFPNRILHGFDVQVRCP